VVIAEQTVLVGPGPADGRSEFPGTSNDLLNTRPAGSVLRGGPGTVDRNGDGRERAMGPLHGARVSDDRAGTVAEGEVSDEELTVLALAADPDMPVDSDAPCLADLVGPDTGGLLPSWYMPGVAGSSQLTAWRRSVALVIVAAFLLITAYGLCNTYGDMVLGRVG
jgi:hypothetical protein